MQILRLRGNFAGLNTGGNMIKRSELGQRIRAARKRAGLTQQQVAENFGIDRTAVVQWESKDPNRVTRPDVSRLEEFAKLTRTPLWWLLSDESDIEEPWPEVVSEKTESITPRAASLAQHLRAFWAAAALATRAARSDLWSHEVWEPAGPAWMNPVLPDVMTDRALVQFLAAPTLDLARVMTAATAMLGFERLQHKEYPRKTVMVWAPDPTTWPDTYSGYLTALDRVREHATYALESIGVSFIEVKTSDEAAAYLVQIL